jgi:uncharacterized protein (TIGR03435 family)
MTIASRAPAYRDDQEVDMRRATVIKDIPALVVIASVVFAPGFLASAQSAADEKTFEVASVRANRSGSNQTTMNRTANGVTIINLPLRAIIQFSYGISQPSRVVGAPGWIAIERFDIVARGTVNGLDDVRVMMQALLADRFKLAAHTEQRSVPAYTLVLARRDGRLGPSTTPSSRECPPAGPTGRGGEAQGGAGSPAAEGCGSRPAGPGEFNFASVPIDLFASILSLSQGRPVIDRTGLAGNYDIRLMFAPDPISGREPDPLTEGRPSLFTAMVEQLGLKLEAGNQLQDVLVIDRVARPDENAQFEKRDRPIYRLVAADAGRAMNPGRWLSRCLRADVAAIPPQTAEEGLERAMASPCAPPRLKAGSSMVAEGLTMAEFALVLSKLPEINRAVRDESGLYDVFDLQLDWKESDIFTALQRQLGLRLEEVSAEEE